MAKKTLVKTDKYWNQIKSNLKNAVRESSDLEELEDFELPDPVIIINDYDEIDWEVDRRRKNTKPRKNSKEF